MKLTKNIRARVSRRTIFVTIAITAILGSLIFVVSHAFEPTYQNRSLTSWLEQYEESRYGNSPADAARFRESRHAVAQIGTNGIPRLLEMVQARDMPFKRSIHALLLKCNISRWQPKYAWDFHKLAVRGFVVLGTNATPAVPRLIKSLEDDDGGVRRAAAESLGCLGDAGINSTTDAIPALIRRLDDPIEAVQYDATDALGRIRWEPKMVVPALIDKLNSTNIGPRNASVTIEAVGAYGTNAIAALPALQQYANCSDRLLRAQAEKALDDITNANVQPMLHRSSIR